MSHQAAAIDHVAITVENMEMACSFYERLFGAHTVHEFALANKVLVRQVAIGVRASRSCSVTAGHCLAALTTHLDLKNTIHVGRSTGGGEVAHYLARHGESRVAKAALISAVPPLMVKTAANPLGLPKEVFDGLQAQLAANRSQFYRDLPAGPFYGYNRPGAKVSEAVIQNWWRQGMMGGAKAHYDGIVAFSRTDFTEDLNKITVPVLVMHSEDDQIVPYVASGPLSAKLLKNRTLKTYKGFPHGMPTTEGETINSDLLAFIRNRVDII